MNFENCVELFMIEKFECKPEQVDENTYLCRNLSHESGLKVGYYVDIKQIPNPTNKEWMVYLLTVVNYRNSEVAKEFSTLDELFNYDLSKINAALELVG